MIFDVGDKVKIRSDLKVNKTHSNYYSIVESMTIYKGRKAKITKKFTDCYRIDIDNQTYSWVDEMFDYDLIEVVNIKHGKKKK
jgi:hypothetical protein